MAQRPLNTPKLSREILRGRLRFEVVLGRIISGTGTPSAVPRPARNATAVKERLGRVVVQGKPVVSYELLGPDEQFSLKIVGRDQISIRRLPQGDSKTTAVRFTQEPHRPLSLSVGVKPRQEVYQAASLWHLLIGQREVCRQHLVPLLQPLRTDWNLLATADRIEEELLQRTAAGQLAEQHRWRELVGQLASDRFSRREAADRQLRLAGRAAVGYLEQLDLGKLDAEQQYRIHRIIRTLPAATGDDTPGQVVPWLAPDPNIWLSLLVRDKQSTSRLAARELESLLGGPIRFDPAADPALRREQIDEIRARIRRR